MLIQGVSNSNIEFPHITTLTANIPASTLYSFTSDFPASEVYLIYISNYDTSLAPQFGYNTTELTTNGGNNVSVGLYIPPIKITWLTVNNYNSGTSPCVVIIGWN